MHPHISGVTQSGARTHSLSSLIDDEHSNHPRDLSISQNSQSNPSQYSAGPEISFHKVFVSTVRPLTYSPVTFVSSFRCTHSDVMLTTNTIFCKDGKKPPNSSVLARLPYSETQQFKVVKGGLSKHSTPMERQKEEALRKRKNKELHTEHAMFMNRLNSERDERSRLESAGAILIQKCARGWLGRPKTEYAKQLKGSRDAKQLLQNTRQRLTHDLLESKCMPYTHAERSELANGAFWVGHTAREKSEPRSTQSVLTSCLCRPLPLFSPSVLTPRPQ